jgi:hypothetical protein
MVDASLWANLLVQALGVRGGGKARKVLSQCVLVAQPHDSSTQALNSSTQLKTAQVKHLRGSRCTNLSNLRSNLGTNRLKLSRRAHERKAAPGSCGAAP